MACCPNGNECNQVVTIGYLKSFVGSLIQNSAGQTVSVNYSDNTYCPTRAELTSGSIIPNHSKGSTPNGDTDGIVVGGSGSNIHVTQSELSLVYTRFKSFSIGASPTTISECGGSSTLSFSHKYTRTTVSMNGSCVTGSSSTEVSDTATNEVSWNSSSFGSVSYPTFSVGKNGSVSAASRSTTVTGTVRFRGTNHSDSVSITQKALTGGYTHYVSSYTVATGVSARATTSTDFGCAGGSYGASATGYYDRYNTYSWEDSCGTNYPSLTTNVYAGAGSTGAGSKSGSFGSMTSLCNTDQYDSDSLSFSYGGYSDSVSFSQSCPKDPSKCADCRDHTEWESYDCSQHPGDKITINGTAYTNCKANDTGGCDCTETPVTDEITCPNCEDYVEWESYDCSQHPGETITVNGTAYTCTPDSSGGCDCTETPTAKTVSCSGGCDCNSLTVSPTSLSMLVGETKFSTVNTASCTSNYSVITSPSSVASASYDANNGRISVTGLAAGTATVTLSYKAGATDCTKDIPVTVQTPPPPGCDCTALTLSQTAVTVEAGSSTAVTFTAGCTASHNADSSNDEVATASVSNGSVVINGKKAGTAIVTLKYEGDDTHKNCSSAITVTVQAPPCQCSELKVSTTSVSVNAGGSTSVSYTANCVNISSIVASNNNITISTGTTGTINITGVTSGTSTITITGSANGTTCTKDISVTVQVPPCQCSELKVSTTSVSVNAGGSTSVSYTANCVSISSIVASNNNITIDTGSTGTIRITGETSGTSTITIRGNASGLSCTEVISVSIGCPTITISPSNGSCDSNGASVTFTHS